MYLQWLDKPSFVGALSRRNSQCEHPLARERESCFWAPERMYTSGRVAEANTMSMRDRRISDNGPTPGLIHGNGGHSSACLIQEIPVKRCAQLNDEPIGTHGTPKTSPLTSCRLRLPRPPRRANHSSTKVAQRDIHRASRESTIVSQ